ncbi:hypothetical protein ACVWXM_006698 [Bradyrhizobium sp. GM7.3]|jgi:hypothetical protein
MKGIGLIGAFSNHWGIPIAWSCQKRLGRLKELDRELAARDIDQR